MLHHLSDVPGIGGSIKGEPEDFVVEEITAGGRRLSAGKRVKGRDERGGEYARFVLEKREWNTPQALQEIASRLRVGQKRFGYAGTKDRRAVTVQLCSAWGVAPEAFKALGIPGIKVNGAWRAKEGVRLGDLSGNAFTIRVRGAKPRSAGAVKKIFGELCGAFPNYFGSQRFGSVRANTHLVGKAILRGDLEGAAKNYLCFTEGETNAEALSARARLAKEMDFGEAVEYFPRHLKYERAMLIHLAEFKNDYAGALRSLPRGILLMFVHAFQSMLWNEALSERISAGGSAPARGDFVCPKNRFGFPDASKARRAREKKPKGFLCLQLIGSGSEGLSEFERALLRREELTESSFSVKSLPELGSRGGFRAAFAPLKGFRFSQKGGEAAFRFSLPPGSYATSALREFLDEKKD